MKKQKNASFSIRLQPRQYQIQAKGNQIDQTKDKLSNSLKVQYLCRPRPPLIELSISFIHHLQKTKSILQQLKDQNKQKEIMEIVYRTISVYPDSKSSLKILIILDFMLKIPTYNAALEEYMPQFYETLFRHIYGFNSKAFESMKIIRKFWLGRISNSTYNILRDLIQDYHRVNIDIIQEDALISLKEYYQKVLHLTPQQILIHIPQIKTINLVQKSNEKVCRKFKKERSRSKIEKAEIKQVNNKQKYKISSINITQKAPNTSQLINQQITLPKIQSQVIKRKQDVEKMQSISTKRSVFNPSPPPKTIRQLKLTVPAHISIQQIDY